MVGIPAFGQSHSGSAQSAVGHSPSSALLARSAPARSGQGGAYVVWNPLWPTPQYDRLDWTLTVLDLPDTKSYYYWAFQDGFVGGGAFYFGLQPYGSCPGGGNCKIALFSFFGNGATTSASSCLSGADGGPGMSCHIPYNWSIGVPYRFTIQLTATDAVNNTETWSGTVTDTIAGSSTEIGNWTIPGQNTTVPGLIGTEAVSFVEYYEAVKGGCRQEPYAKVNMSVPTGSSNGTVSEGGVNSTFPTQTCSTSAAFTLLPDATNPTSVTIETGKSK
jgi:hypothetical protein